MKTKKRKSCSAPAQMGGKGQRISNCVCYLCFFRWFIGDWPLYRHLQTDGCLFDRYLLYSGYFRKRGSNYGDGHYPASISRIIRHFSHKGAYGALFRVRCMITEHLSKVPLGALDERRTGDIKTVLNEDIEKLELCLAHNIPELVGFATGPVVIFIYLMTINVPLAMISLIPLGITLIIMVGCFAFMAGMMPHVTEAMANFNSVIIEYINGMKLIKAIT